MHYYRLLVKYSNQIDPRILLIEHLPLVKAPCFEFTSRTSVRRPFQCLIDLQANAQRSF